MSNLPPGVGGYLILASAALVVIGIFIRLRIEETPDFKRVMRDGLIARYPVVEAIWRHPKDLIIGLARGSPRYRGSML